MLVQTLLWEVRRCAPVKVAKKLHNASITSRTSEGAPNPRDETFVARRGGASS